MVMGFLSAGGSNTKPYRAYIVADGKNHDKLYKFIAINCKKLLGTNETIFTRKAGKHFKCLAKF